jgi:hypothetical protein
MMCPADAVDNPVSCEIHAFNSFLRAKNTSVANIHLELCAIYDQNVMSEGTVRQCCRMLENRRTNVHDERSGRPAICCE